MTRTVKKTYNEYHKNTCIFKTKTKLKNMIFFEDLRGGHHCNELCTNLYDIKFCWTLILIRRWIHK